MEYRWIVESDGNTVGLFSNKSNALDRICCDFVYLRAGVISQLNVKGRHTTLEMTKKKLAPICCSFVAIRNGKRFVIDELYNGYTLNETLTDGHVWKYKYLGLYTSFRELFNWLITEHKEKNV